MIIIEKRKCSGTRQPNLNRENSKFYEEITLTTLMNHCFFFTIYDNKINRNV